MSGSAKTESDIAFMVEALAEARAAAESGEVPVGAVVVHEGRVVARAHNRTIADCDPTCHAEMAALREAARAIGNYRLNGATLYVTVEPCAMCAGALIQARVARLVYGCEEPKGGAVKSSLGVLENPTANHRVEVVAGVMAEECAGALREFFEARR
jgi:tRNA(adenine34) deaminase